MNKTQSNEEIMHDLDPSGKVLIMSASLLREFTNCTCYLSSCPYSYSCHTAICAPPNQMSIPMGPAHHQRTAARKSGRQPANPGQLQVGR